MKHIFRFSLLVLIVAAVSCSKTHYAKPTPSNYRLHSVEIISHVNSSKLKNENYTFRYDLPTRVSGFVYSSNDTAYPNVNVVDSYNTVTNKIYKTYFAYDDSIVLRRDSFQYNYSGQIIEEWTPYAHNTFTYNGKLLAQMTNATYASTLYNAADGDFYKSSSAISTDSALSFQYFKTMNNRIGDYLQLRSFLVYGVNIYQNSHLLNQTTSSGYINNITYLIDADSKITQTNATVSDSVGDVYYYTYNLAYETY